MTATTLPKRELKIMVFKDWTTQALEDTFNLKRLKKCTILNDWLSMDYEVSEAIKEQLEVYREDLDIYALFWNEMELRLYFIGPLMNMVNFRTSKYQAFAERSIAAPKGEFLLKGNVDLMVASGKYEPKQPFFFFHEYKKEAGIADDPLAQVLSAMLAGQELNQHQQPVYGAYVIGRNWFFLVLNGDEYCISKVFAASNDEIIDIYRILINMKVIIERDLLP